jgi:hypothetical protein
MEARVSHIEEEVLCEFTLILLDFAFYRQLYPEARHLLETNLTILRLSC